jgi:hypothetical protein
MYSRTSKTYHNQCKEKNKNYHQKFKNIPEKIVDFPKATMINNIIADKVNK